MPQRSRLTTAHGPSTAASSRLSPQPAGSVEMEVPSAVVRACVRACVRARRGSLGWKLRGVKCQGRRQGSLRHETRSFYALSLAGRHPFHSVHPIGHVCPRRKSLNLGHGGAEVIPVDDSSEEAPRGARVEAGGGRAHGHAEAKLPFLYNKLFVVACKVVRPREFLCFLRGAL
eukprot:scaffold48_cov311-Pinguiococcus_pyrenoidosus.AAC.222